MIVMVVTVVISLAAGLAFRRRFIGAGALFTLTIASLIIPSILAKHIPDYALPSVTERLVAGQGFCVVS